MVIYEFGHMHIVCTRASNIGTSRSTHTDALLHTRFLDELRQGEGIQKTGINFSTRKTRGKIVPVVKLRHAKVVVVDGMHVINQWHAFVPVSHRRVVLFPEKTLWRSIGGVEGVLCCCCGACLRCCFGRLPVKWKRSCWYVTDKYFCVAFYLTCSLLLIAD